MRIIIRWEKMAKRITNNDEHKDEDNNDDDDEGKELKMKIMS